MGRSGKSRHFHLPDFVRNAEPQSVMSAQVSLAYCRRGRGARGRLTPAGIHRSGDTGSADFSTSARAKVRVLFDDEPEEGVDRGGSTSVAARSFTCARARELKHEVEPPDGPPGETREREADLRAKFMSLAIPTLGADSAGGCTGAIRDMARCASIREFAQLLHGHGIRNRREDCDG